MRIIISGTPGTGKTSVADLLAKKTNLPVLHVTELIQKEKLADKNGEVDLKILFRKLKNINGIIESHLLCEIPLDDTIVVLRCNPSVLKKRLAARKYPEKKVQENLEAEALDYCTQVAEQFYFRVVQVDTTKLTEKQVADKIVDYLENHKTDNPDFSDFLFESF